MLLKTATLQHWQLYQKITRRFRKISTKSRKSEKKHLSKKNDFSTEYSRGHVEGTLYTPAGIILPDINEFCPRTTEK